MTNFEKWDKEFRLQNLFAFNNDENALLWLKVRAVCRGMQIQQFLSNNKITLSSTKISEQNIELFEILESMPNAMQILDDFLNEKNHECCHKKEDKECSFKSSPQGSFIL